MLRYVFMGTPEFASVILERVAEKIGPPVHVVTQPARSKGRGQKVIPTAVQALCETRGWAFDATDNVNSEEMLARLQQTKPDLILVAAFGQILKKGILEMPARYCLNVHGSLLPHYRGAAPVQRAILNGDVETGITIQRMARKLDTGDILVQKKAPILRGETSQMLLDKLSGVGADALLEAVQLISAGKEQFIPQDESQASHAAKLDKKEAKIDWNRSAKEIERQIYGLQPWPNAETVLGKDRLQIFKAEAIDEKSAKPPGEVITDHKSHLKVCCGQGVLALTEIQLENRKRLAIVDFLRGYRGNFPFSKLS